MVKKSNTVSFQQLREIGDVLNSTLEPGVFFKIALDKCMKFTRSDKGSMILINNETDSLDIVYEVGLGAGTRRNLKLKLGEGITGLVAAAKKPQLVNDADKNPDYISVSRDLKAELAVPIIFKNKALGVVSVDSCKKNNYSKHDVELLSIVATQIGQVLSNIDYTTELKARLEQDKLLLEINRELSNSLDLTATLEGVLNLLKKSGRYEKGALIINNEESQELVMQAYFGYSRNQARKGVYKVDEGIVGKVYRTAKPVAIRDISADKYFLDKTESRKSSGGIKSFFCIPMIAGSRVIGIMIFDKVYENKKIFDQNFNFLKMLETQVSKSLQIHMLAHNRNISLQKENEDLRNIFTDKTRFGNLIGRSDRMKVIYNQISAISPSDSTVLITGESGTGKELVAASIHYNSRRRDRNFVAVNCGAIPENLLESELFGYKKGAFTGAVNDKPGRFKMADEGTLFLDEIGELPLNLQSSLLRVLQDGVVDPVGSRKSEKVDVRILAATNRDLLKDIKAKKFRQDLYYRLSIIPIALPPLRERKEDIPLLIQFFLDEYKKKFGKDRLEISKAAGRELLEHDWKGNIRELRNVLERSIIFAKGNLIDHIYFDQESEAAEELPGAVQTQPVGVIPSGSKWARMLYEHDYNLKKMHDILDRTVIDKALRYHRGVSLKAAEALGISRETLRKRVKELGIDIYL